MGSGPGIGRGTTPPFGSVSPQEDDPFADWADEADQPKLAQGSGPTEWDDNGGAVGSAGSPSIRSRTPTRHDPLTSAVLAETTREPVPEPAPIAPETSRHVIRRDPTH